MHNLTAKFRKMLDIYNIVGKKFTNNKGNTDKPPQPLQKRGINKTWRPRSPDQPHSWSVGFNVSDGQLFMWRRQLLQSWCCSRCCFI